MGLTDKLTTLKQQIAEATSDEQEHTLCLQLLEEARRAGDQDSEDLAIDLLAKWDHEQN